MNRHKPYYYENPVSETGVLLVHGIFASPVQFTDMANILRENGYSVMSILLPGHGDDVHSFSKATIAQWKSAVSDAIHVLSQNHIKVVLIGHSLGSLLVLDQSIQHKVDGIVLLSPPIRVKISLVTIRMSLHILFANANNDTDWLKSYCHIYSIDKCKLHQLVMCIPPMLNLLKLSKSMQNDLLKYTVPTFIVHSKSDETVRTKSIAVLEKSLPNVRGTLMLEHSRHCYIDSSELEIYNEAITQFIRDIIQ